jgi:general secretion pathway protein J
MTAPQTVPDRRSGQAGFTLIEMLIATVLMVFILAALATVTAQWLPNWKYGMARIERDERLAFALKRLVEDVSVAEFVPANAKVRTPYFDGDELGVSFVRTAIGPNSRPGLEVVRFQEIASAGGPTLVRERAAFVPLAADAPPLRLVDPVVLIRPPYRVAFAYAGADDLWQPAWHNAVQLPRRIRITVRDGISQQKLAVSTVALLHIDTPAECARSQNASQCVKQIAQAALGAGAGAGPTPAPAAPR